MITVAPSRANASAVAFPIPRLPPVTIATLLGWLIAGSKLQLLQVLAKRAAQVVAPQCEFDSGLQKAQLVASVIARALETIAVDGTVAQQVFQRVGELDFSAASRLDGFDG